MHSVFIKGTNVQNQTIETLLEQFWAQEILSRRFI